MTTLEAPAARLDKLGPTGLLVGAVGLLLLCGSLSQGAQFWQSYMYGWIFIVGLSLGCLALTLLHHTIRSKWTLSILRMLEAGSSPATFLLLALAMIPIRLNLAKIYVWADPSVVEHDKVLQAKVLWLNADGWTYRSLFYLAFFMVLSYVLGNSSRKQDQTMDKYMAQTRANISAPSLVLFTMVATVALTDWVMSLQPRWFSTVYGLLSMIGQCGAIVALGTVIICANAKKEPFSRIINTQLTKDLGNILFALTMVWSYLTLSQFLIIWSGNLPEETPYYRMRSDAGWNWLTFALITFRFVVPFCALLSPKVKAVPSMLMKVAILILVMHVLDVFWIVVPGFQRGSLLESIKVWDLLGLLGFTGLWFFVFGSQIKRASPIPLHDPRLTEVAHHA